MNNPWEIDDLLAGLYDARKRGDLGRLAFLAYCDVRRWAREAGRHGLADLAAGLVTQSPRLSREAFLDQIDLLVRQLEALQGADDTGEPATGPLTAWPGMPQLA
jgi:hypothetical protein